MKYERICHHFDYISKNRISFTMTYKKNMIRYIVRISFFNIWDEKVSVCERETQYILLYIGPIMLWNSFHFRMPRLWLILIGHTKAVMISHSISFLSILTVNFQWVSKILYCLHDLFATVQVGILSQYHFIDDGLRN